MPLSAKPFANAEVVRGCTSLDGVGMIVASRGVTRGSRGDGDGGMTGDQTGDELLGARPPEVRGAFHTLRDDLVGMMYQLGLSS